LPMLANLALNTCLKSKPCFRSDNCCGSMGSLGCSGSILCSLLALLLMFGARPRQGAAAARPHEVHRTWVGGLARAPLHSTGLLTIETRASEPLLSPLFTLDFELKTSELASIAIVSA
jgi:hypothetical protein